LKKIIIFLVAIVFITGCGKEKEVTIAEKNNGEELNKTSSYIKLPDISNILKDEALVLLEKYNFKFDFKYENSNEVLEDYIIGYQNYKAGDKIKKDKFIYILVSLGPSKITIDDYYGKNIISVEAELKSKGIQVIKTPVKVNETDYDEVYDGMIINQDIKKDNSIIELYYALLD